MKVLGCTSIPIIVVKMVIERMQNDGKETMIYEKQEGEESPFWVFIPKHVAKKLAPGDTVTVACVPVKSLEFATETLALKIHRGERTSEILFDRDDYSKLMIQLKSEL